MTELFKERVEAFQMCLEFQAPYAASIRAFMRDVILRIEGGAPLEPDQAKLPLTQDTTQIRSVLEEWAALTEISALRIRESLAKNDPDRAFDLCLSWPSNYWRIYENIIDTYAHEANRFLQTPREASQRAISTLLKVFPVNMTTDGDPMEGRLKDFEEQLRRYGNPWRGILGSGSMCIP